MAGEPDVSACIATYRRPEGLARLLDSLEALALPGGARLEVIVVDNDPERSAETVVASRAAGRHPLRYCVEPRPNVSLARNRGVAEARGRWIAFVDDDEAVEPGWLEAYWGALRSRACDGWLGPVLPRLEGDAAGWPDASFYERPRHPTGAPVGVAELRTSNALLRRELFAECAFDPRFGGSGGHAEDTELFGRLWEAGARFRWCDEAVVLEFVPPERRRLVWLARRAFHGGFVHSLLSLRRARGPALVRGLPRALLAAGALLAGLPLLALAGRRRSARAWLRLCVQAGHLWAFAGGAYGSYGRARAR